jgi:hypothetical protein
MLCDFCAQIPLDPETLSERYDGPGLGNSRYPLGSIARVRDSSCPFCRIISKTLSEGSFVKDVRDETELSWTTGLFGRRSFSPRHAAIDTWICFGSRVEPSGDQIQCSLSRRQPLQWKRLEYSTGSLRVNVHMARRAPW